MSNKMFIYICLCVLYICYHRFDQNFFSQLSAILDTFLSFSLSLMCSCAHRHTQTHTPTRTHTWVCALIKHESSPRLHPSSTCSSDDNWNQRSPVKHMGGRHSGGGCKQRAKRNSAFRRVYLKPQALRQIAGSDFSRHVSTRQKDTSVQDAL